MKKIPTLFEREFENHRIVRILPNISPDLAWVMAGDGVATIKWDGACCAVINGVFYKRYDAKALNLVGDGHFVFGAENKYLMALRDVLKEAVNDQYDYIDWWLYEATDDYTVWEADCTMKYCLKDPEALYDYITGTLKPVPVSSGESTSQQE